MSRFALILIVLAGCVDAPKRAVDVSRISKLTSMMTQPETEPLVDNCCALKALKISVAETQNADTTVELPNLSPPPAAPVVFSDPLYLVKWTRPNCPPCRRWDQTEKSRITMSLRVIDGFAEPALARKHKVSAYPTFQLCSRATGKVITRWVGFTSATVINAKAAQHGGGQTVSNSRQTYQPVTYQPTQQVSYGSHWSIATARNPWRPTQQETIQHLLTHGVNAAGMSLEQMLTRHDQIHGSGSMVSTRRRRRR